MYTLGPVCSGPDAAVSTADSSSLGAVALLQADGVAGIERERDAGERGLKGREAGFVAAEADVAAEPAEAAVAEGVEMGDEGLEGLGFVAEDGVTVAGVARGDGDDAEVEAAEFFEEGAGDLADEDDALKGVAGGEEAAEFVPVELVFGTEEHGGVFAGLEGDVQAVLDVAEIHRGGVEAEGGAEDDADLAGVGGGGRGEVHALRGVAAFDGVGPDAVVAVGADALAAAVEDQRDQRLRDAEFLRELGLGNFFRGAGHGRRFNN